MSLVPQLGKRSGGGPKDRGYKDRLLTACLRAGIFLEPVFHGKTGLFCFFAYALACALTLRVEGGRAVSNEIKDANLQLLIGLKEHLDQAERLRILFERLLTLARTTELPHTSSTSEKRHVS